MLHAFLKASDALAKAEARSGDSAGLSAEIPSASPPLTGGGLHAGRDIRRDAAVPEPLRQRRDGGWRGGAWSIRGAHDGVAMLAGVDARGRAWLSLDGARLAPIEVTYAPWGFRMTVGDLVQGVSYAAGLRPIEGPPRLSILPYGPGLLQFGTRIRVLCEPYGPHLIDI